MTLVIADMLNISITLLLVALVVVCFLLILVVLMQRPKQEGLGAAFGGGMTDQMFGARTTNVLQTASVWLGGLFLGLTLLLAILQSLTHGTANKAIKEDPKEEVSAETPAAESKPEALAPSANDQIGADLEKIENATSPPAQSQPASTTEAPEPNEAAPASTSTSTSETAEPAPSDSTPATSTPAETPKTSDKEPAKAP